LQRKEIFSLGGLIALSLGFLFLQGFEFLRIRLQQLGVLFLSFASLAVYRIPLEFKILSQSLELLFLRFLFDSEISLFLLEFRLLLIEVCNFFVQLTLHPSKFT
jgi:hypothetical protein